MADSGQYEELLKKYSNLQTELEQKNQALYDCERQKKTAEASVEYCQEEIRNLQDENASKYKDFESKIQQLEEINLNLQKAHSEQIIYLESSLTKKQDEIDELKRKLEDITKLPSPKLPVEDEKLITEICELKEQNEFLSAKLEELTKSCEAKDKQNAQFQDVITQLKSDLEEYKEILSCKKFELDEANSLIQTLKDDFMCVKSELDLLKSTPLDNASRGNSLFAEVDDRRVQLQQNMNTMKTRFLEMKRERASHLKQISALRSEVASLLARWKEEVIDAKTDEEMILQSYKNQIQSLQDVIESYKTQLNEKTASSFSSSDGVARFFDKMLQTKNAEIQAMGEKLSAKALNGIVLSHDLAHARKEIRKLQLANMELKNNILQLKTEIEEIKLENLPQETTALPQSPQENTEIKSIVKKDMKDEIIDLDETNKENSCEKKVQFSSNTIEPTITDRSRFRRGVKILESKPIYIPSTNPKKSDE